MNTEEKTNSPEVASVDLVMDSSAPEKKNNQKGKHRGHPYNENCTCAICKRRRNKIEKDSENKKAISEYAEMQRKIFIQEFIDNLPADQLLLKVTDENIEMMLNKISQLKNKFQGLKYNEFMPIVINTALNEYLKKI